MKKDFKSIKSELDNVLKKTYRDIPIDADIDFWSQAKRSVSELISQSRLQDPTVNKIKRDLFQKILRPGAKVLDAGCGGGYHLAWIARNFPELQLELYGFDLSEENVKRARKRLKFYPHTHFVNNPCEYIPFSDENFDVILSFAVVQYCLEPLRAISEMERVLKQGGYLIVYKGRVHHLDPLILPDVFALTCYFLRSMRRRNISTKRDPFTPRPAKEIEIIWMSYLGTNETKLQLLKRIPVLASFKWDFYKRLYPRLTPLLVKATFFLNELPFNYYKDSEIFILRKGEDF